MSSGRTFWLVLAASGFLWGALHPAAVAGQATYDPQRLFESYIDKASAELKSLPLDINRFRAEVDLCDVVVFRHDRTNESRAFLREALLHAKKFPVGEIYLDLRVLLTAARVADLPDIAEEILALFEEGPPKSETAEMAIYYLGHGSIEAFQRKYQEMTSLQPPANLGFGSHLFVKLAIIAATNKQTELSRAIFADAVTAVEKSEMAGQMASYKVMDLCSIAEAQERFRFSEDARNSIDRAIAEFRRLNSGDFTLSELFEKACAIGDIAHAEQLIEYFPPKEREDRLIDLAVTEASIGQLQNGLDRLGKISNESKKERAYGAIATVYAFAGRFGIAEELLSKTGAARDGIYESFAVAHAMKGDWQTSERWVRLIKHKGVRRTATDRAAYSRGQPFIALEPSARQPPTPFLCGTPMVKAANLRKDLERKPYSVSTARQRTSHEVDDLREIGEVLAVDRKGVKLLSDWEKRFKDAPLRRAHLHIGAARGIYYSHLQDPPSLQ